MYNRQSLRFYAVYLFALLCVSCALNRKNDDSPSSPPPTNQESPPDAKDPVPSPPAPSPPSGGGAPPQAKITCSDDMMAEKRDEAIKITAFDVLQPANLSPVNVSAKAEKRGIAGINSDLDKETMEFSVESQKASAITDSDGVGKASLNLPGMPAGSIICYQAVAKNTSRAGRVFFRQTDRPIFISDIDEVLSPDSESGVLWTSRTADIPTFKDAPEVMQKLSRKYDIIYLTARDDALFNKTREWLTLRKFPTGPIFVWDWKARNLFGANRNNQRIYKVGIINNLKKQFPNIVAGIGNRPHDAEAYVETGIKPYILEKKSRGFPTSTIFVETWGDLAKAEQL
jgi:phosphatidate phosphatase APP1